MQIYTDPTRETDPHALPNAEVFFVSSQDIEACTPDGYFEEPGYYWWPCFPGCLPDGDPIGPFETEAEAIADAQSE